MMTAQEFIENHISEINGWLQPNAVYVTEVILNSQRDLGVNGINLEIGVWQGKYISAITAMAPERPSYGMDVFLHNQQASVEERVKSISGSNAVTMIKTNTFDLDNTSFQNLLRSQKIAFASVDGSHEADPVLNDLNNVSKLLERGGVIAIDDFLNPLTLGVLEGATKFLINSEIEPICYSSNKLFVTTRAWSQLYQIRLQNWLDNGASVVIMGKDKVNWAHSTTYLYGRPVLAI